MNEAEFAYKLVGHLSASTRDVNALMTLRLRRARTDALTVQRRENLWPFASVGQGVVLRLRLSLWVGLRTFAMVVTVLTVFAVGQHWSEAVHVSDYEEIDAALLIDDLPIDAYLDRDFKAWVLHELQS